MVLAVAERAVSSLSLPVGCPALLVLLPGENHLWDCVLKLKLKLMLLLLMRLLWLEVEVAACLSIQRSTKTLCHFHQQPKKFGPEIFGSY